MKQSEIIKCAAEILEIMESKNLSNDEMLGIIARVYGSLTVQKMNDELDKKRESEPSNLLANFMKN